MYTKKSLQNFIFFDEETIPAWSSFDEMPGNLRKIWLEKYHFKAFEKEVENRKKKLILETFEDIEYKAGKLIADSSIDIHLKIPSINEIFIKEAALHPEFAKIYCISFGVFDLDYHIVLDTFCCDNEIETLQSFIKVLHHFPDLNLFGYNSNEFDIPFLLKRMWINKICTNYPPQLQLKDAKPWTVKHQDHMLNYKAGTWQGVSLGLLCEVMGIKTPKDKFDNSEFTTLLLSGSISKKDAIEYCEKDVKALMEIVLELSDNNSNYEPGASTTKNWAKTKAKVTTE